MRECCQCPIPISNWKLATLVLATFPHWQHFHDFHGLERVGGMRYHSAVLRRRQGGMHIMDSKGNSPAAELQFRGGAAGRAGASRAPPEPDGEGVRILGAVCLALEAVPGRGHRAAQAEVGDAALLSLDKFMNRYAEWLSPPYLLSTHDVKVEGDIVFLPLYMSGLLSC